MTILIDEKKTTTDSYFYKVPCITSTFTAEILFVDGELHDVVGHFGGVPERERWELYGAIAEKIAELEKKYWLTLVDEKLKPATNEKPEVPTMQYFVDRFREECPNCDIHFFGDSAGGSIWNDKHGCVDWHPEKGETIDQAMKQMKEKIDG